jgi:hypothetical protein
MAEQRKPEADIVSVVGSPQALVADVDRWAARSWRDRAKILWALCCRALETVRPEWGFQQDVSDVSRRLRLDPPHVMPGSSCIHYSVNPM